MRARISLPFHLFQLVKYPATLSYTGILKKGMGGSLPVKTIYHWGNLLWGGNTIVYVTQSTFKVKVHRKL